MVTFEFSAEIFNVPRGCELSNLTSLKVQVPFCNIAAEQDPFRENLIDPLSSGMLNLSVGVKVVPFCACVLGQTGKNIKTMMRKAVSPVRTILMIVDLKVSLFLLT